jgi:hypothetical protein
MSEVLSHIFLSPAIDLVPQIPGYRKGLDYSDEEFVILGLSRIQSLQPSGRGFLQSVRQRDLTDTSVRAYFAAAQSDRRLGFLHELNRQVSLKVTARVDRFAAFPELRGRELLAIDGHAIQHATHEPPATTAKGSRDVPASATGIFLQDLRTGATRMLAQTQGHQHEWAALKEQPWSEFHWVAGSKNTLWIIDPVAVDFAFLRAAKYKGCGGVITRTKTNLSPTTTLPKTWDKADPRNEGVNADERVHFGENGEFRRIGYLNPETGESYEFLTTEFHLPPGVIAQLYRLRWDIEKFFDVCENVWAEKRAWGAGAIAAQVQNEFLVLTQNLVLLLNEQLEEKESLRDEKSDAKYAKALEKRRHIAEANGRTVPPWVGMLHRITRWSCQYTRWLADALVFGWTWKDAIQRLRPLLLAYMR